MPTREGHLRPFRSWDCFVGEDPFFGLPFFGSAKKGNPAGFRRTEALVVDLQSQGNSQMDPSFRWDDGQQRKASLLSESR
jgi:hypothetical protein